MEICVVNDRQYVQRCGEWMAYLESPRVHDYSRLSSGHSIPAAITAIARVAHYARFPAGSILHSEMRRVTTA